MVSTYKATLRGNRLEWSDGVPEDLPRDEPVTVYVTIVGEAAAMPTNGSQGQRMAAALEKLAATHALSEIADAAVWERETRQDRNLPDRTP